MVLDTLEEYGLKVWQISKGADEATMDKNIKESLEFLKKAFLG